MEYNKKVIEAVKQYLDFMSISYYVSNDKIILLDENIILELTYEDGSRPEYITHIPIDPIVELVETKIVAKFLTENGNTPVRRWKGTPYALENIGDIYKLRAKVDSYLNDVSIRDIKYYEYNVLQHIL